MSEEKTKKNSEEVKIIDSENKEIQPVDKKKIRKRKLKNTFFFVVWIYILSSIFITNIDTIIISEFNIAGTLWYIILKTLILSIIFVLVWLKIGNKRFWKNIGLFFLFPIYPGFWIFIKNFIWGIPKYLLEKKYHILLYYYLELFISFFVKIKTNIFKFSLFVLSFILMFELNSKLLYLPISFLVILQIIHIVERTKESFSPMRIFKMSVGDLDDFVKTPNATEKLDEIITESTDSEKSEEEKKYKGMERYLIINEFANAFNFKLKEIINRRIYMFSFLGKALFSFFIAMVYFGAINFCLYKIDPNFYNIDFSPKYFDFFYYSFFTIFPDGTDIEPVSTIAKVTRMAGVSVGVLINLLLLTVYLTISNERFKENLSKLSLITDNYTKGIQNHFEKKYGCNPTDGLKQLNKFGSKIDDILKQVRKHIKT
ncbi:hypothetical protein SAMN05444274_1205 [Mariniphaga anaerophila]|uniref:Uncharacterized protein n=1 Tax=Mariniphaga anaerophila TaxID=1484053 RepID=A0A1M5GDZ4_9BACT|nr:hypothetical protein [Mariniphaga anaerophila]SHG02020.1 hypothetical protein SAMN05444274_1205 [Mariniphaga anaerophila]